MIFGKQSIEFRDPHHKAKHQLMDQIAERAERLKTDALQDQIGDVYGMQLTPDMTVLEGVWQSLRLAIPRGGPRVPDRSSVEGSVPGPPGGLGGVRKAIRTGRRSACFKPHRNGRGTRHGPRPSSVTAMNGDAERCWKR